METSVVQERARGRTEFKAAQDVEGVSSPDVDWKVSDYHYLEILIPNRVDMVLHVFSLLEDPGAWAPPDGTQRMVGALGAAKDTVRLSVGEKWAELTWEPEALPEYFHRAMQRFEADVQIWLIRAGIMPGVIRCDELLKALKKRAFPAEWTDFQKHMALTERVRQEGMRPILVQFGHDDLPEVPGPDVPYLDSLVPTRPGSWCIRVFDLVNKVMDRGQLADSLIDELLKG